MIIAVDINCSTAVPDNEAKKTPRIEKEEKASEKFLHNFSKIQEKTQKAIVEHKIRMQKEAHAFQAKLEQDRLQFDAQLTQKMQ